MEKESLDQDFWKAAVALKKGTISDVVKTRYGYHIIRLEDKTEAAPIKFAEIKKDLIAHLQNEKTNMTIVEAVKAAKAKGFAKVSKF